MNISRLRELKTGKARFRENTVDPSNKIINRKGEYNSWLDF